MTETSKTFLKYKVPAIRIGSTNTDVVYIEAITQVSIKGQQLTGDWYVYPGCEIYIGWPGDIITG